MAMKIVGGVIVVIALFLGYVAMQPGEFHYERSVTINAPPEAIFPYINSSAKQAEFNPWFKLDPAAKVDFDGPQDGVGSAVSWDGNSNVGAGKSTIVESIPASKVGVQLDFLKPMASTSMCEFDLRPEGNQTVVTWSMNGKAGFVPKIFHTFMNMDKMMGDMFDQGLAMLKQKVEAEGGAPASAEGNTAAPEEPTVPAQ